MTAEEKRALNKARVAAVKQAWKDEQTLVAQGKCSRQWTKAEVAELKKTGHVTGYAGHHMKSARHYPHYAGDANNIQFLTTKEHISQAHRNNTRLPTNGYYNPQTHRTEHFRGQPHKPVYTLNTSAESRSTSRDYSMRTAQNNSAGRRRDVSSKHSVAAKNGRTTRITNAYSV